MIFHVYLTFNHYKKIMNTEKQFLCQDRRCMCVCMCETVEGRTVTYLLIVILRPHRLLSHCLNENIIYKLKQLLL